MAKSTTEKQIFQDRDSHVSQSSPTDKSRAHVEAVYRDTDRVVDGEVYRELDQTQLKPPVGSIPMQSPIESVPMKATGWSLPWTSKDDYQIKIDLRINAKSTSQCQIYKSMPSTDGYGLQDILYRVCRSTALSPHSSGALELGKYNHFRKAYVLDVYECDLTSHDAIKVYDR